MPGLELLSAYAVTAAFRQRKQSAARFTKAQAVCLSGMTQKAGWHVKVLTAHGSPSVASRQTQSWGQLRRQPQVCSPAFPAGLWLRAALGKLYFSFLCIVAPELLRQRMQVCAALQSPEIAGATSAPKRRRSSQLFGNGKLPLGSSAHAAGTS